MRNILNPKREWEILNYEMFENRPSKTPYPLNIARRRNLLLLAQSLLAKYQYTESRKYKDFFGELYRKTMATYFNW
jgi:hypothetical protein